MSVEKGTFYKTHVTKGSSHSNPIAGLLETFDFTDRNRWEEDRERFDSSLNGYSGRRERDMESTVKTDNIKTQRLIKQREM